MKKRDFMTAAAMLCTAAMLAGTVTAAHPLKNAEFVWNTGRDQTVPAAAAEWEVHAEV